jgi:hypothetical protein
MNVTLNDDVRRAGGRNRDLNRPEWEKQLMGMIAGSSRPLKKDHPAAHDVPQAVSLLRQEAARFPWVILSLVGRDGRSVRGNDPALSDAEITARVHQMGGPAGMAGLIFLTQKNKHSLVTFIRPFISKEGTIERLTNAMDRIKPSAFELLENEVAKNEDDDEAIRKSPIKGMMYLNETLDRASIFYDWQEDQPEPGWQFVGVYYAVRGEDGRFHPKARATNVRWSAAMAEHLPRFEATMKKFFEALSSIKPES